MSLQEAAWFVGAVTGPPGLVIAILVFLRDRPRIDVTLLWDMVGLNGDSQVVVRITNVGRRPAYVSHVHTTPRDSKSGVGLFTSGIAGLTLKEGDPPHVVTAVQGQFAEEWASEWWRVRAAVVDAAGRTHLSPWPTTRPTFATEDPAPLLLLVSRVFNVLHRWRPL